MLNYIVVEIKGKQYRISPNQKVRVDFLGEVKTLDCDKVLVRSEGEKVEIGTPYLKDKIAFEVVENIKADKVRVATYHAKANTRKVRGFTKKLSVIQLAA